MGVVDINPVPVPTWTRPALLTSQLQLFGWRERILQDDSPFSTEQLRCNDESDGIFVVLKVYTFHRRSDVERRNVITEDVC